MHEHPHFPQARGKEPGNFTLKCREGSLRNIRKEASFVNQWLPTIRIHSGASRSSPQVLSSLRALVRSRLESPSPGTGQSLALRIGTPVSEVTEGMQTTNRQRLTHFPECAQPLGRSPSCHTLRLLQPCLNKSPTSVLRSFFPMFPPAALSHSPNFINAQLS